MLHAFGVENGVLSSLAGEHSETLDQALWLDLVSPTRDERQRVEAVYGQELPESDDVGEIEASARYYEDEDGLHVHSLFLQDIDGQSISTTVAFIVSAGRLITLHQHNLSVFRLLRLRSRRERDLLADEVSLLLGLFETKVENLADRLERVHTELERIGGLVLAESSVALEDAIDDLTRQEDVNGKIRLCLMDTQRALTFLLRRGRLNAENREWVREILRDVDSLLPHNQFLFEKVNFLMDAALGFINIEQNQIIKIFSIAAVVFLPPTMVASIYGMNFEVMPELDWTLGYPLALVLMALSGIAPYVYFKRKGWM